MTAMRRDLVPLLVCPLCKGELTLTVAREVDDEIVEGSFECPACGVTYPIEDGIPNMLPPDLRA
jgi:uncharacterized protein YbaR (Trm112 family)